MDFIKELNNSYKHVCDNSKHVCINYEKIDQLIDNIDTSTMRYWLDSNPYEIMNMDLKDLIDFLLIYHTIGDYCFWGEPKWEIETTNGKLDGSYAIMFLIINRFKIDKNFDMSYDDFKIMLKGNVEIPLLNDRYNNLVEMNNFLKKHQKSFFEMVKDLTKDAELLEFIVNNLSYFEDFSNYDGKKVLFYKRAQLLTSDILHVMRAKGNLNTDYSQLIGCADYKIPQVMRCYGMLEFSQELAYKVDNKIELPEGLIEETEIRANTLAVINYIYEKLDRTIPRMDINDSIWLLGQDKSKMIKPYHRTLTKHY